MIRFANTNAGMRGWQVFMLTRFFKSLLARPANSRNTPVNSPPPAGSFDVRQARISSPEPAAPGDAAGLNDRGLVHLRAGELVLAESSFLAALKIHPGLAEAWTNRGIVAGMRRQHVQSLEYFMQARALSAQSPAIENNIALALCELNRHAEASQLLYATRATGVADDDTIITLAGIERVLGSPAIAESLLATLSPSLERDVVLALVLLDFGRIDAALRLLNANLIAHPEHHQSRLVRGMVRIASGDFVGWSDYEARRFTPESPLRELAPAPQWQGQSLSGSRVLVYAEQGIGDEIMFAHCLPDLVHEAAEVTIETEPRLARLFERSFPGATIISNSRGTAEKPSFSSSFNFQMPIGSLPSAYRLAMRDFEKVPGYLTADKSKTFHYRSLHRPSPDKPSIGIAWRGGLVRTRSAIRSLKPSDCSYLFSSLRGNLVSLQYDVTEQECMEAGDAAIRPVQYAEAFLDFDETAALVNSLDAIITVCCSIAHLSGALGKPVWVLVPTTAEWRYGIEGSEMPWYPSMTMVRQSSAGDWRLPLEEIVRQVNAFLFTKN